MEVEWSPTRVLWIHSLKMRNIMRGVSRDQKVIATRVQVARESEGPGQRRGSYFESIGSIPRLELYRVVQFDMVNVDNQGAIALAKNPVV